MNLKTSAAAFLRFFLVTIESSKNSVSNFLASDKL